MNRTTTLVGLFFFLLFFGLFLGDGKQSVIEVYGAAITIVLWLYFIFSKQDTAALPNSLALPWVGVGVAAITSTIFSDDIGFSISWLVRLSCGYLLYQLFYSISSKQIIGFFQKGALLLTATAGVLWVCALLFPWFKNFLPSMNLIDVRYGHSHLADLLVFISPIVWSIALSKQRLLPKALLSFVYLSALLATQSRGAWLLVGLFVGMQMFLKSKKMFLLFLVSLLTVFGIGGSFLKNYKSIEKVVVRPTASARLEYWRQAIESIKERPFLGSGPGTFSLTSLRLQSGPNRASWFVHSQPLQIASEMGLIGFGIFVWLVVAHVFLWKKESITQNKNILFWMIALIFVYGSFEFVLDYFVIWVLFWAGVGLVSGVNQKECQQKQAAFLETRTPLVFIGIFYILWVSSVLVMTTTGRSDIAYYLAPFDATQTLLFINNSFQPNNDQIELINYFNKNFSAVLFKIGDKFKDKKQYELATKYYREASVLDPQNTEYYSKYFELLAEQNKTEILGEEIIELSKRASSKNNEKTIIELKQYKQTIGEYYKNFLIAEHPTFKHGYAGLYYRLGIVDLRDVELTEKLLLLARDLYPDMAHLHIELATFYYFVQKNKEKAMKVLQDCQIYDSPQKQCKEQTEASLRFPGEFKDVIW